MAKGLVKELFSCKVNELDQYCEEVYKEAGVLDLVKRELYIAYNIREYIHVRKGNILLSTEEKESVKTIGYVSNNLTAEEFRRIEKCRIKNLQVIKGRIEAFKSRRKIDMKVDTEMVELNNSILSYLRAAKTVTVYISRCNYYE